MKISKRMTIFLILLVAVSTTIILLALNVALPFPTKSPSTLKIKATKLVVIIDGDNVRYPGRECNLIIMAVDDAGVLDTGRNDTVHVLVEAGPTAKANKERVVLINGQAEVKIVTFVTELVYIRAIWESGPSYLSSGQTVVIYLK